MIVVEEKSYGDFGFIFGRRTPLVPFETATFFPKKVRPGDTVNVYVYVGKRPSDKIGVKVSPGGKMCKFYGWSKDKDGNYWGLFKCTLKDAGFYTIYTTYGMKNHLIRKKVGQVEVVLFGKPKNCYKLQYGSAYPKVLKRGQKLTIACDYGIYAFPAVTAGIAHHPEARCKWAGYWKGTTTYFICDTSRLKPGYYYPYCTTFKTEIARSVNDCEKKLLNSIKVEGSSATTTVSHTTTTASSSAGTCRSISIPSSNVTFFPEVVNRGDEVAVYVKVGRKPIDCIAVGIGNQVCKYAGYSIDANGDYWVLFKCRVNQTGRLPVYLSTLKGTRMNCCASKKVVGYIQAYSHNAPLARYRFVSGSVSPNRIDKTRGVSSVVVKCNYGKYALPIVLGGLEGNGRRITGKWIGKWWGTTTAFVVDTSSLPAGSYRAFCTTFANRKWRSKNDYDKAYVGTVTIVGNRPQPQPQPQPQSQSQPQQQPQVEVQDATKDLQEQMNEMQQLQQQIQELSTQPIDTQLTTQLAQSESQTTAPAAQTQNVSYNTSQTDIGFSSLLENKTLLLGAGAAVLLVLLMNRGD